MALKPKLIRSSPDSKVRGANMEPIWGRQDPGGPHVGHMSLAIWEAFWKCPLLNGNCCYLCSNFPVPKGQLDNISDNLSMIYLPINIKTHIYMHIFIICISICELIKPYRQYIYISIYSSTYPFFYPSNYCSVTWPCADKANLGLPLLLTKYILYIYIA